MVNMIGIFDEETVMLNAIKTLRSNHIRTEKLSVLSWDTYTVNQMTDDSNIKKGVPDGGTIGGVAGIAIGSDAVVIPGLSAERYDNDTMTHPTLAGILLTGGVNGHLETLFRDHGFSDISADKLEHDLATGKLILSFYVQDDQIDMATHLLKQKGALDVIRLDTSK